MISPVEMLKRKLNMATHRIYTLPMLVLMPFGGCNCRCEMCDIWRGNRDARGISWEDLAGQLASLESLKVRRVVLSGGEALMHPDLWELCELLRRVGIKVTLLSNGLLLERDAARVVRWCDEVTVSLDGPRELHDAIRGVPGAFDQLAEGVAALRSALGDGMGGPLCPPSAGRPHGGAPTDVRVPARCVVQRRNYPYLHDIIGAAHDIGLDRLSFLAVDVSTGSFNRPESWTQDRVEERDLSPAEDESRHSRESGNDRAGGRGNDGAEGRIRPFPSELLLDLHQVAEFGRIVDEVLVHHAADFESGFIAEGPEKLRRLPAYFAAMSGFGEFPGVVCNAPWVSAVVEADGRVRPCFFHRPLGNLHDGPLEAILNSPEAVAFRRGLDVARDPICRRCVCTLHLGLRAGV